MAWNPKNNPFMTPEGKQILEAEYYDNNLSIYAIADKYDTYPNMIRRAMLFHKLKLREKEDAQKEAYRAGRKQRQRGKKWKERGEESIRIYGMPKFGRFGNADGV